MKVRPPAPLLPSGTTLFEGLPSSAVVLDELPAVVGDGVIVVSSPSAQGTVTVRDHAIAGATFEDAGNRVTGEPALAQMRRLAGASVSASRLDPSMVDLLVPFLLSSEVCYGDLRLGWTDWHQLIADLRERGGAYLAQLSTPAGSGVTIIRDGEHCATYTSAHPDIGDPSLLDELAGHPGGTAFVLRVVGDNSAGRINRRAPVVAAAREDLLPDLKLVARARLHRSATRVERLLDDAAQEARPLDDVLTDIRHLAIRGVMPATLEHVADDMRAVAGRRAASDH